MKKVSPFRVMTVMDRASALEAQGEKVIHMEVGEPDFNTPDEIKTEAIKAIRNNFTKYTPVDGILDLKKAIKKKIME